MRRVEVLCPDCKKLITKVEHNPDVIIHVGGKDAPNEPIVLTEYGYCRRCKKEKIITYHKKSL